MHLLLCMPNYLRGIKLHKRYLKTSTSNIIDARECRKFNLKKVKPDDTINVSPSKTPRVIIVGAGVAGLSAAVRLIKAGIKKILVLEATERPGGRIYSCWLGNTIAEVGAQWISGGSLANSVITLATQEGLLDDNCILKYDNSGGTFLTSDGRPLDKSLSSHAYLIYKQIEKQAYSLPNMSSGKGHGSLLNFLTVRIEQELNNFPGKQREDAARILYGLTNKLCNRWGTDVNKMSADLFGTYTPMCGETVGIPIGFVGILAPLIRQIPDKNIKYSKIVDCIKWDNLEGKKARVIATTCDDCSFEADYVIITVSLGVLKSEVDRLFCPKLPKEKVTAIKKIGFGNISKIFVEYGKPFWVQNQGPMYFAWSPNEIKKKDNWIKGVSSLQEIPGSKQILLATVSGKFADEVEKMGDMEIAESITKFVRQLTRDPTIPYPDSILRSKWRSSPFFMGSNSFMGLETTIAHQLDLSAPLPDPNDKKKCTPDIVPVAFFAGEATSKNFFSTVHGARISGLRAAQEIINLTKKFCGPPPRTKCGADENDGADDCF